MEIDTFQSYCDEASKEIFSLLQRYGGSVSAEHGVGLLKKNYLRYTRSDAEIRLMRTIKQIFDPNDIMNPAKLIDPGEE